MNFQGRAEQSELEVPIYGNLEMELPDSDQDKRVSIVPPIPLKPTFNPQLNNVQSRIQLQKATTSGKLTHEKISCNTLQSLFVTMCVDVIDFNVQ